MIKTFAELKEKAQELPPISIAFAAAEDEAVLNGAKVAIEAGILEKPVFTGAEHKIESILAENEIELSEYEIWSADSDLEAAQQAVKAVRTGRANTIAKGNLKTLYYLKAILDKEKGLSGGAKVLSNLTLFAMESYHKFIAVTDNAITPQPDLQQKKAIIENTRAMWDSLHVSPPKVAVLAAVETVSDKMQATVEASCLDKMADRSQIEGFLVEGPLSYDVAMDSSSAERKGMGNFSVPGDPDLLLMPNLEAGNMVGKSFKLHGNANSGGVVLGGDVPVILNSRADGSQKRLNSLLLARVILA